MKKGSTFSKNPYREQTEENKIEKQAERIVEIIEKKEEKDGKIPPSEITKYQIDAIMKTLSTDVRNMVTEILKAKREEKLSAQETPQRPTRTTPADPRVVFSAAKIARKPDPKQKETPKRRPAVYRLYQINSRDR